MKQISAALSLSRCRQSKPGGLMTMTPGSAACKTAARLARTISTAVFLLGAVATMLAATEAIGPLDNEAIRARVLAAPEEDGEDARILFSGRYYHEREGRVEMRVQRLLLIYTEYALEEVGDPVISIDSRRHELVVHACRSYLPDGSCQDSPENAYNDATPRALAMSADHLHLREIVLTHVGLEPGVCIWLDYTLRDLTPPPLPFQTFVILPGPFPTQEIEVYCSGGLRGLLRNPPGGLFALPDPYPSDRPLRANEPMLWQFRDLPAGPGGAAQRLGDQVPWLSISMGTNHWRAFEDLVDLSARDRAGLEEILSKLEEEEGPWLSTLDALESFARMMGERTSLLRYRSWRLSAAPRPVSRVLATSTATPAERCALFLACCQSRDIGMTLLRAQRWEQRASYGGFELLPIQGVPMIRAGEIYNYCYVDPMACTLSPNPFSRADIVRLFMKERGGVGFMGFRRRPTDRITLDAYWNLRDSSLKLEGRLHGQASAQLSLEQPESFLRDWAASWGDSVEVKALRVLNRSKTSMQEGETGHLFFHFSIEAVFPLPDENERGRVEIALPMPPVDFDLLRPPGMNPVHSRQRARLFPHAGADIQLNWIIDLPEDRALLSTDGRSAEYQTGSFTLERALSEQRLAVSYSLEWNGSPIEPADYPAYRQFVNRAFDPAMTRLVLGNKKED